MRPDIKKHANYANHNKAEYCETRYRIVGFYRIDTCLNDICRYIHINKSSINKSINVHATIIHCQVPNQ